MTEAQADFAPVRLLYEGLRLNRGEPVAQFSAMENGEKIMLKWGGGKSYSTLFVGHLYDIPSNGQQFRVQAADWKGGHDDEKERAAIVTAHNASRAALSSAAQSKKLAKYDMDLTAVLRPLFKPYSECKTWEAQCAFEALVMTALRKSRMEIR